MKTEIDAGQYITRISKEDFENMGLLIKTLKDRVKLPEKNEFKQWSDEKLWLVLVAQLCVMGGSRNWDKAKDNDEFKKKISLKTITEEKDKKSYIEQVFEKYKPTRFNTKCALKVYALTNNKKIVSENKVTLFENLDASMNYEEVRTMLMGKNPFFKMKSASDLMIETGLSDNVVALDTRIIGMLRKHFDYNLKLSDVQGNKDVYLSLEEGLREICKESGISLGLLDRILYKYSNKNAIAFLLEK